MKCLLIITHWRNVLIFLQFNSKYLIWPASECAKGKHTLKRNNEGSKGGFINELSGWGNILWIMWIPPVKQVYLFWWRHGFMIMLTKRCAAVRAGLGKALTQKFVHEGLCFFFFIRKAWTTQLKRNGTNQHPESPPQPPLGETAILFSISFGLKL